MITVDEMIEMQIKKRGIRDRSVLNALYEVPRKAFIPEKIADQAYEDTPLPIGCNQTISQPYIVAYMTQALQLCPSDRVLEIGTGCGYQTAILAEIVRDVFTIELLEPLYKAAKKRLIDLGYDQIHFLRGDGYQGWPEEAPFNKIIVTAAAKSIPPSLESQLANNGIMIIPIGDEIQNLILGVKEHGNFHTTETIAVRFVPLVQSSEKE